MFLKIKKVLFDVVFVFVVFDNFVVVELDIVLFVVVFVFVDVIMVVLVVIFVFVIGVIDVVVVFFLKIKSIEL